MGRNSNSSNKSNIYEITLMDEKCMTRGAFSSDDMDVKVKATKADQQWAEKLFNSSSSIFNGQGSMLLKAIKDAELWRVAFAIHLNDNLKDKHKFISASIGQKSLLSVVENGHEDIADYILSHSFLSSYGASKSNYNKILDKLSDINNKDMLKLFVEKGYLDINALKQQILYNAVVIEDKDMCSFILDLGSDHNEVRKRIEKRGNDSELFVLFYCLDAQKEKLKKKEQVKQIENKTKDTKDEWEVMDDNKIVQHDTVPSTSISLETIFNFKARNVMTICCVAENVPATVVIQKFKDVEDDKILFDAWNKLKDLGKTPEPFTGNDNFTVHKPSPDKNLKIEGR